MILLFVFFQQIACQAVLGGIDVCPNDSGCAYGLTEAQPSPYPTPPTVSPPPPGLSPDFSPFFSGYYVDPLSTGGDDSGGNWAWQSEEGGSTRSLVLTGDVRRSGLTSQCIDGTGHMVLLQPYWSTVLADRSASTNEGIDILVDVRADEAKGAVGVAFGVETSGSLTAGGGGTVAASSLSTSYKVIISPNTDDSCARLQRRSGPTSLSTVGGDASPAFVATRGSWTQVSIQLRRVSDTLGSVTVRLRDWQSGASSLLGFADSTVHAVANSSTVGLYCARGSCSFRNLIVVRSPLLSSLSGPILCTGCGSNVFYPGEGDWCRCCDGGGYGCAPYDRDACTADEGFCVDRCLAPAGKYCGRPTPQPTAQPTSASQPPPPPPSPPPPPPPPAAPSPPTTDTPSPPATCSCAECDELHTPGSLDYCTCCDEVTSSLPSSCSGCSGGCRAECGPLPTPSPTFVTDACVGRDVFSCGPPAGVTSPDPPSLALCCWAEDDPPVGGPQCVPRVLTAGFEVNSSGVRVCLRLPTPAPTVHPTRSPTPAPTTPAPPSQDAQAGKDGDADEDGGGLGGGWIFLIILLVLLVLVALVFFARRSAARRAAEQEEKRNAALAAVSIATSPPPSFTATPASTAPSSPAPATSPAPLSSSVRGSKRVSATAALVRRESTEQVIDLSKRDRERGASVRGSRVRKSSAAPARPPPLPLSPSPSVSIADDVAPPLSARRRSSRREREREGTISSRRRGSRIG